MKMKDKKSFGLIGNIGHIALGMLHTPAMVKIVDVHLEHQKELENQLYELTKIYACSDVSIDKDTLMEQLKVHGFMECKRLAMDACGFSYNYLNSKPKLQGNDLRIIETPEQLKKRTWKDRMKSYSRQNY